MVAAGLDAVAHEQNRDALTVGRCRAMTGRLVHADPAWLHSDDEITAAPIHVAERCRPLPRIRGGARAAKIFGAKHARDAWPGRHAPAHLCDHVRPSPYAAVDTPAKTNVPIPSF